MRASSLFATAALLVPGSGNAEPAIHLGIGAGIAENYHDVPFGQHDATSVTMVPTTEGGLWLHPRVALAIGLDWVVIADSVSSPDTPDNIVRWRLLPTARAGVIARYDVVWIAAGFGATHGLEDVGLQPSFDASVGFALVKTPTQAVSLALDTRWSLYGEHPEVTTGGISLRWTFELSRSPNTARPGPSTMTARRDPWLRGP